MVTKVLAAPVNSFFDVTPTGTLLNRYSKDLQILDREVQYVIGGIFVMFYQLLSTLIVMVWTNWKVTLFFPFVIVACISLFKFAVAAYKETNRVEAITKSPLLNFINESFSGVATIHAFGKQEQFVEKNFELLDKNILANQACVACLCWYSIRMDIVTIALMTVATLVAILYRKSEDPVLVSMAFSYALQLNYQLIHFLYYAGDLEKKMVSIVRCFKLNEVP
mmetsp:Transcript_5860/g.9455  ORF Transcript_5860/g.9455 Transcript_5860/m.9455 type:complete len:222 (-) Transcript_5860:858-1523(-)